MKKSKDLLSENPAENITLSEKPSKESFFGLLFDTIRGFFIGIAFIIPGFSGGSVAAILGIYEKLVSAIADLFSDFKRSVKTLLPIMIGLIIGAVSLLYPLGYFIEAYPFPTVSLFVGLAIGGIPSITSSIKSSLKGIHLLSFLIPCVFALSLSFIPVFADKALCPLSFTQALSLVAVGFIGSCALVIPGISGSMLLLILGFYNPIINIVTDNLFKGENLGNSVLVLALLAMGIGCGFIIISKIMKVLLAKCPTGCYVAILGFIIGSLPTVYISTAKEAGYTSESVPTDARTYIVCIALLLIGIMLSLGAILILRKRNKKSA